MEPKCVFTKDPDGLIIAKIQHYCAGYYDRFRGHGNTKYEALQNLIQNIKIEISMAQEDLMSVLYGNWVDETNKVENKGC